MADSRTKNAVRNMNFGIMSKFVTMLLPFITRTIVIKLLGEEYLGLGTLFTSILSYLSLTELGLSSAIVYSMYKPIAEKDYVKVSAYLNFYKKLYRLIGTIILVIGTVLLPFIPYLIKGEAPDGTNVYILYYIYLINSVISYFFAGYRQSLLSAHQRQDITNKILMLVSTVVQALQIAALYFTRNFYVYAFVPIVGTIITNIANYLATRKMYKQVVCSGTITKEERQSITKKIGGLFGTKLNSVVVHSTGTMVISAFIGLTINGRYGNYYYIMNTVCGFIMMIFSSLTAGVGNKIVTDSVEENYKLFKKMSFLNALLVGVCCTCFICLFEPFVEIWVGKERQLGMLFVVLFTGYFFIYEIQRTVLTFKDAAGLWYADRIRPYASMATNLVFSLVLVQFIGIYGVVTATILAFLISLPWANSVLFKNLFNRSGVSNLFAVARYFVVTAISCALAYYICTFCPSGVLGIGLRLIISVVVSLSLFILLFFKTEEFGYVVKMAKGILKKIRH